MDKILKTPFLSPGSILKTPSGRATFRIEKCSRDGIRVIVGEKGWPINVPAECWEGISDFLRGRGWVKIGAIHERNPEPGSLDQYVQQFTYGRSAASYVAPILERAGLIKIDRGRPNKILLI